MFSRLLSALALSIMLISVAAAVEPAKQAPSTPPAASTQSAAAPSAAATSMPAAAVPADPTKASPAPAAPAPAPTKVKPNRTITITMFLAIIGITLGVVVWAAKRTTTAADFYAINYQIISIGAYIYRIGIEHWNIFEFWRCKRMMFCIQAFCFFVPFK